MKKRSFSHRQFLAAFFTCIFLLPTAIKGENDAGLARELAPALTTLVAGAVLVLLSLAVGLALALKAFRSRRLLAIALALHFLYLGWVISLWSLIRSSTLHLPLWLLVGALLLFVFTLVAPFVQYRRCTLIGQRA